MIGRSNSRRTKTAPAAPLLPTGAVVGLKEARTDPAPQEGLRPSDLLVARLQEIKRISKSLTAYFDSIGRAHSSYANSLSQAAAPSVLQTPFPESSLFLPTPVAQGGQAGWADFLVDVRNATTLESDAHVKLGGIIQDDVVVPLRQIRLDIKHYITELDKELHTLANDVVKKREASVAHLTALATSLASHASSPLSLSASEDPFIVRAASEQQMREQVTLENDLLTVALKWQESAKNFEQEVFVKFKNLWKVYDTARVEMDQSLLGRDQEIATRVSTMPTDLEWNHFASLNHLIPPTTTLRSLDQISYPNRDAPAAIPIKEGVLEREKRFVKNWKQGFFVLTPSGYLHEYPTPSTPLSTPKLSLFLPHCHVGPLPAPQTTTSGGKVKEAKFVIEGRKSSLNSGGIRASLKLKHREVGWSYRARSWEEAKGWWVEIEKFTKTTIPTTGKTLKELQGPAPTAVQRIGMAANDAAIATDDEVDEGGSSDEEVPEQDTTPTHHLNSVAEEEKPEYTETPGVASGAIRDRKVKMGLRDEDVVPGASGPSQPSSPTSPIKETTPFDTPVTTPAVISDTPSEEDSLYALPPTNLANGNSVAATNNGGTVEAPVSIMKESAPSSVGADGVEKKKKKRSSSFFKFGKEGK